jgi:hypothetical protein
MNAIEFIGYTLKNTSAVTNIVSSTSIVHGLRPSSSAGNVIRSINILKISGNRFGVKQLTASINCRGETDVISEQIQSVVMDTLVGSDGLGKYASVTAFSAYRIALVKEHNTIPETEGTVTIYNSPVDISIVY